MTLTPVGSGPRQPSLPDAPSTGGTKWVTSSSAPSGGGGGGGGFWHDVFSIPSQIGNSLLGIGPGVGHLVATGVQSALAPVRLVGDVLGGHLTPAQGLMGVASVVNPNAMPNLNGVDPALAQRVQTLTPMQHEMAQSFRTTGGNLLHPTHYARAFAHGEIVPMVLQDAGNLSLVAGGAGKVLGDVAEASGSAGLARAANVAERVSRLGGETANAPVSIARKGLNLGKETALKYLDQSSLAESMPGRFTEIGRHITSGLKAGDKTMRRAADHTVNDIALTVSKAGASQAEQGAAMALLNGVGQVDKMIHDAAGGALSPEEVRRLHTFKDFEQQSYSPEIQQIVHDYQNGTLDPEAVARIHAIQDVAREKLSQVQQMALEGHGLLKGPLDPAYLGDAPIDQNVMLNLKDAGLAPETMQAIVYMRQEGVPWADIERRVNSPELTNVLNTANSYPTAWRPSMEAALSARAAGIDVPLRPEELLASGMERPTYLPGGNSELIRPSRESLRLQRTNVGTEGVRGVGSENMRGTGSLQPYSALALASHLRGAIQRMEGNASLIDTLRTAGMQKVADVIDPETLTRLQQEAETRAKAQIPGENGWQGEAHRIFGELITEQLRQTGHGFEVFNGDLQQPKPGDFNPSAKINLRDVAPTSTVLPAGLKADIAQQFKKANPILRGVEKGNSFFKRNVLPWRPTWQLGDLLGGPYMGWIGGGIDPVSMWTSMRRLKAQGPEVVANFEKYVQQHPQFAEEGLNATAGEMLNGGRGLNAREARRAVGAKYDTARNASFRLNRTLNAFNRHSYVLERLDRTLAQNGLGSVEHLGADSAAWEHPKVQEAINSAVADANKVMGTFSELTPMEQRYLRPMFTFYPWLRHITALAARTAIDNPVRMMWAMRVGSLGAQGAGNVPAWMKGSIPVGNALIPTSYLNPFNDVVGGGVTDPLKAMSPVIKLAGAGLFGVNLNKKLAPITRPGSNGKPMPLLTHPGELAYQAAKMFPITNNAMSLAPTGQVAGVGFGPHPRYDSGGLIVSKKSGQPITDTGRLRAAAGLVGLPQWSTKKDAQAIVANASKKAGKSKSKKIHFGL